MKLAIDARELSVGRSGGLRSYAESVVASLAGGAPGVDITAYLDRDYPGIAGIAPDLKARVCLPSQLALREQITLPRALRADGVDLAHFLANTAPLRTSTPYILTLHDTFCLERPLLDTLGTGSLHARAMSLYSKIIPARAARRAKRVVTVSDYSRLRISKLLKISSARICVIRQALHPRYTRVQAPDTRRMMEHETGADIIALIVGSSLPRKNLAGMLEAFRIAQSKCRRLGLVLSLPSGLDFDDWAARVRVARPENLHLVSSPSDDLLVRLYSSADIFLFVSHEEGFGIPVVEAMACGCPVVTASTSCLPDTAGGAALLADPADTEDIADKITQLVEDVI